MHCHEQRHRQQRGDPTTGSKGEGFHILFAEKIQPLPGELLAALSGRGLEPYLDKQDIAPGEPWQSRLAGLIAAADVIVLAVSPNRSHRPSWPGK